MISALQARLADSLARAQEADDSLAVLHVALGRPVSGTPSWADGELSTLLVGALRGVVRVSDSVLCTEPQEAWILLPGCDFDGAAGAADRIGAALEDLEASVGIAIYPDHSAQPSWLARHAELASTRARNASSAFAFAEAQENDPPGAAIIHELPAALRDRRLIAHFQPQLDLATRRTVAVEALVRWDHPERGILEPAAFLPLAQMTRLGTAIDFEMLRIAARQVAAWRRAGRRLPVATKVAGRTLLAPGFVGELRAIMKRAGADAELLKLEVPEEAVASEPRATGVLAELRELGVRVCIERFGSGASSLAAVERLQVDELKLDPDLIHLAKDARHVGSLASIVAGGHALGMKVSATHLDSETVVRATWGLGCDLGQGFALGRPVPAHELPEVGDVTVTELPEVVAAATAGPKVLRLPELRRPQLPRPSLRRPRIAASSAAMRFGSAAALVAAGILAGSLPMGGSTLGAVVAGYVTAPATAVFGSHLSPAAGGSSAQQQRNGSQSQAAGGQGSSSSSSSSSTSGNTSNGGSTSTTGTGTTTGSGSTSGTVPLPLPSVKLPSPLPSPVLPLPTPSNLLP